MSEVSLLCACRGACSRQQGMCLPGMVDVPARDFASGLPLWQEWQDGAAAANTLPEVAIGARVLITSNLNIEKGAVNGAQGQVASIVHGVDSLIRSIHVKLGDGTAMPVYRSVLTTKYHSGSKYQRTSFPLQLCSAVTANRSQGMTAPGLVLLHMREWDCPCIAYMMVTRVKHRNLLKIVGSMSAQQFRPMPRWKPAAEQRMV